MLAGDLISFLEAFNPEEEVYIEIEFPEVGGWTVTDAAYHALFNETDGWPCLQVQVFGSDFDYPYPENILKNLPETT